MKIIFIILAIYVALDIIVSIAIYAILRINGWNKYELARGFRNLLKKSADDFLEDIVEEVSGIDFYENGFEIR